MEKSLDGGHCCEATMVCDYEGFLGDDCKQPTVVVMSSLSFNKEIWWRIVKDHTNSIAHPNCDKQCRNNSEYSRCSRQLTTFG